MWRWVESDDEGERVMSAPVFKMEFQSLPEIWYFVGLDGAPIGPYPTQERAEAKYWEYCDYTVNAPECHHPTD